MKIRSILIVIYLALVIAAPGVDAIACDHCKDIIPIRDMRQNMTVGTDQSKGISMSSDTDRPVRQKAGTVQDLCPLCANIGAAMGNACCGTPAMISEEIHPLKLIAFSDPSYSITKPPQN